MDASHIFVAVLTVVTIVLLVRIELNSRRKRTQQESSAPSETVSSTPPPLSQKRSNR